MFAEYRIEDIRAKMHRMEIRPLDVMVTGVTGAGKSTTLNALFGSQVAKVGNGVDPETMELSYYKLNDVARFWDTPGLGDGVAQDKIHSEKIIKLLSKTYNKDGQKYGWIDLVLVILDGSSRDLGTAYTLLNEVIVPNFSDVFTSPLYQKISQLLDLKFKCSRILVAINQYDVAMKGRHWDELYRRPDTTLENFLRDKADSVKRRVKEATGVDIITPVCYSAEYGYNIDKLMDLIIDNIPQYRRLLFQAAKATTKSIGPSWW